MSASMRAATRAARRANDAPADSDAQRAEIEKAGRAMMAHVAHCDLACEIIGARDAVVAMMAQKDGAR